MNYTRKRALLACDFCRHRKRRCDGNRPCSTCKDSNANCVYKELPFDRVEDASPSAVVDRLARIESLLEQQSQQINQLGIHSGQSSYPASQVDYPSDFPQQSEHMQATTTDASDSPQFLIPMNHVSLTSTLLSVPLVRELLGEYPRDFFFQIEENLPLPGLLDKIHDSNLVWPPFNPALLRTLIERYFQHAHPHHPIFTPQDFRHWHEKLLEARELDNIETSICFSVYALGMVCSSQELNQKSKEFLGLQFFQPALKIMLHKCLWCFRPNIQICQAFLLAASYFSHIGRPLHSWRMAHLASRMFLVLVENRKVSPTLTEFDDVEVRIFWQCFLIECDRVTELDIPRSGIEPLGDKMPLPHSTEATDTENHVYFIAEHAIRRLLNRIHNALYGPDSSPANPFSSLPADPTLTWQSLSLQKLYSLSSELNRQLEEWYHSIPEYLRPPKGTDALPNDRARVLRIRYYDTRQLIHRPFLLLAASRQGGYRTPSSDSPSPMSFQDPGSSPAPVVLENCMTCIDSCAEYLYNAVDMMDKRSPYLWSLSQSCMACLILLWVANNTPSLYQYVPAMQNLQGVVLGKLRTWEASDSIFEAEVRILERLVFSDHMVA